jgi:hypothetical protein
MSLVEGAKRPPIRLRSESDFGGVNREVAGHWKSGNPAFGFPLLHCLAGRCECGNHAVISKAVGAEGNLVWFSSASFARYFASRTSPVTESGEQLRLASYIAVAA